MRVCEGGVIRGVYEECVMKGVYGECVMSVCVCMCVCCDTCSIGRCLPLAPLQCLSTSAAKNERNETQSTFIVVGVCVQGGVRGVLKDCQRVCERVW